MLHKVVCAGQRDACVTQKVGFVFQKGVCVTRKLVCAGREDGYCWKQVRFISIEIAGGAGEDVGWHLAESMTEDLVIPVLQAGIRQRQPALGLIQHTDRGGQYASTRYRAILRRADIRQSLSRADNCYANAFMESGFGTLQTELEMTEYQHQRAARREIGDDIAYYNLERKHSALGYLSPHQFKLSQSNKN